MFNLCRHSNLDIDFIIEKRQSQKWTNTNYTTLVVAVEDHIRGIFIQITGEIVQVRREQPIRTGIGTRILEKGETKQY